MAIKELILHGVTSIEPKLSKTSDVASWNSRRIRFEMDDGTSFTVIAFADHKENLKLNIEIPTALKGEN
tara:strand:+ start:141 stop:347 length:207 start_codon:yes stop_codon:yes gene_type:complete